MSRHRLFRGNGVEEAFDDGHNDRWDVREAMYSLSPASMSPTSAQYIRRAQGSSFIGEGTKVRAVYDGDGNWYEGRVVRVMTGGRYGVQFNGYDDWETCTKVEPIRSPQRPPPKNIQNNNNNSNPPAPSAFPSSSATAQKAAKEPWDLNLIKKEMPQVRAVVGEGIEESVVMEAIRRCNYNAERAILELVEDGSTFAVPIQIGAIGGGMTDEISSKSGGSSGLGAVLNNGKKASGLAAALTKQYDVNIGTTTTGSGSGSGSGGSSPFGSPGSPHRRSRTRSDSCELSDLDALLSPNSKKNATLKDETPSVPTVARTKISKLMKTSSGSTSSASSSSASTSSASTSNGGGSSSEAKSDLKKSSGGSKTLRQKSKNNKLEGLRQQSKNNTPKKVPKADQVKRKKMLDELLESNSGNTKDTTNTPSINGSTTSKSKPILNMVVIGHVDAGKSTMMGHLLWKLGEIDKRTMRKFEKESNEIGKSSFKYAWALDEQGEERERGVTIDVATKVFHLPDRQVVLLDAPGHKDFIPNMISGASQADVALLVVAAGKDEFASGFVGGGQTKEHLILVRSMGIKQIVIAVNKMDMVDWSQIRYNEIVNELKPFLKATGFKSNNIRYVPVSGLGGENLVVRNSNGPLSSWSGTWGPTLAECINEYKPSNREKVMKKPLRMSIADVYKHQRMLTLYSLYVFLLGTIIN